MQPEPIYKNPKVPDTDQVYRTNIILWAAMLFSQLMFLVLVFFAKPEVSNFGAAGQSVSNSNYNSFSTLNPILIVLAVLGLVTLALSFVLKNRLLKLAIDNKQIGLVQTAQILAYALCEATTLFGLVAAFTFNTTLFLVWFAAGITGLLLHYPRQSDFNAASFTGIN